MPNKLTMKQQLVLRFQLAFVHIAPIHQDLSPLVKIVTSLNFPM